MTRAGILPKVDMRGDGGYAAMPPSLHKTGNYYEWIISPDDSDLADLPLWVLVEEKEKSNDWKTTIQNPVLEGSRNEVSAQMAGKMLGYLPEDTWEMVWFGMQRWNQNNKPPLPDTELKNVFNSIASRELKQRVEKGELKNSRSIDAIPLSQLVTTEYKNTKWLVDRLIPHEALTIISGAPRSYKTFITLDIALKVAGGEKLFDEFQTRQSPVLIIDEENHPRILKDRAKLLLQNAELPIFISSKKTFLLTKHSVGEVIEYAKSEKIELVIFDSLNCIHEAEENSASEMRGVMKLLKEITNHGIAVVVIHHHRKKGNDTSNSSQEMRGSSDILAQADCHISIDRKGNDTSVVIYQNKLREAQEMEPFVVHFHKDGDKGHFEYGGKKKGKTSIKETLKVSIKQVLEASQTPLIKSEIWKLVKSSVGKKGGHSTFKAAIEEMIKDAQLFTEKGAKNSVFCSLAPFSADDG
jgi:archaellum biogenesis ATPase FlaH